MPYYCYSSHILYTGRPVAFVKLWINRCSIRYLNHVSMAKMTKSNIELEKKIGQHSPLRNVLFNPPTNVPDQTEGI